MTNLKFRALKSPGEYQYFNLVSVPKWLTHDDVVEQYIGIADVDGSDLYEGDVITSIYQFIKRGIIERQGLQWVVKAKPGATVWYLVFADVNGQEGKAVKKIGTLQDEALLKE